MPTAWGDINNINNSQNNINNSQNNINNSQNNINDSLPKIAVCIPYNSNWYPEWVERTYLPLMTRGSNLYQKVAFLSKVPSLPVARDLLVNQALKVNADYILFLDIDHVFEFPTDPNVALDLLYKAINKSKDNKDGKIVSAIYRAKQDVGYNYAMWIKNDDKSFSPVNQWTGNWIEIDVAGLGCCLIDTVVFKNIPQPWFLWNIGGEMSEDFYFYQLAKKNGYNAHAFTDIRLSHLGGNLKVKSDGSIVTSEM